MQVTSMGANAVLQESEWSSLDQYICMDKTTYFVLWHPAYTFQIESSRYGNQDGNIFHGVGSNQYNHHIFTVRHNHVCS